MSEYNPETLIELHAKKYARFYATGVMDPKVHWRLVQAADTYAAEAGIRPSDLYIEFKTFCKTADERNYITMVIRHHGMPTEMAGLYYGMDMDPPIIDRYRGIVAALLRHFVASKLIMQGRYFDMVMSGDNEFSDTPVLCLPDLFRGADNLSEGMRRSIASMLLDRYVAGNQVCVGKIPTLKQIDNRFGSDVADLINHHYVKVGA